MDSLPDEIILLILQKCSYQEIINIRQINKRLNKSCYDEHLWFHLCNRDYGVVSKGNYSSFKDFYIKFLREWGHLIGVYLIEVFSIGLLVEITYFNNALVARKWESSHRRKGLTSLLEEEIIFKINKHPKNDSVEANCYYSRNAHPCSLIKDMNTRNYIFRCDKYDVHSENLINPPHYIMLLIHNISIGIELKPIILPEKSHIPKELLLDDGSIPEQLIEPGIFQDFQGNFRSGHGIYVFYYKNENELIGNKIAGQIHIPPEKTLLKVFLKYSFVATKENQSSLMSLDDIEVTRNTNIIHVSELPEQNFYPLEIPDAFKGSNEITSCKARFHGRGDMRAMPCRYTTNDFEFSKLHFIVFNNDLIGTVSAPTGKFLYFRRIKQSFEKNIPQDDLSYRALQFNTF